MAALTADGPRLLAVFGYSGRRGAELHPVCAERVASAAAEALPGDTVLFSGRGGRRRAPEAELMARAWSGAASALVLDRDARTTYGNALATAALARRLRVEEVVLVTSRWHAPRATALLRAALRGSGVRVVCRAAPEPGTARARLRELACWTLVPVLRVLAVRDG